MVSVLVLPRIQIIFSHCKKISVGGCSLDLCCKQC